MDFWVLELVNLPIRDLPTFWGRPFGKQTLSRTRFSRMPHCAPEVSHDAGPVPPVAVASADQCPPPPGPYSATLTKGHCDRHLGGYLEGDLRLELLQSVGYGVCEACNMIFSSRYRSRCPSCWPAYIDSLPRPVTSRPLSDDMHPLDQRCSRLLGVLV